MRGIDSHKACNDWKEWQLGGKTIADIVVTHHARSRWTDRIESGKTDFQDDITAFLWNKLKTKCIRTYYKNEQDVFLIDEDLVMVAEFIPVEQEQASCVPLYKMVVITFLGRMSENVELRDLRTYYSWLRHSRRMTLIKNSRKRR